jgi:hypothetical protein
MNLLHTHRADTGICLRPDGLTVLRVKRRWTQPAMVQALVERPIRSGLLRSSFTEANIQNVDELAREVAAAAGSMRAQTIALSLPDGCASIAILPFESLPKGERERETVIRWRFQHDRHWTLTDEQVAYRIFPAPDRPPHAVGSPSGGTVTAYVLVSAIKQSILEQYRRLCEQAGLLPVSMGLSSLHAIDLCRRSVGLAAESFWACRISNQLTFVACRGGVPVFFRGIGVEEHGDVQSELLSSLQSFDDECPHGDRPAGSAPVGLYIMSDRAEAQQGCHWEGDVWTPAGSPHWQVEVRDGWSQHRQTWPPGTVASIGGWCALASTEAGGRA